jgi:hypothetical protein
MVQSWSLDNATALVAVIEGIAAKVLIRRTIGRTCCVKKLHGAKALLSIYVPAAFLRGWWKTCAMGAHPWIRGGNGL